ncbi:MAG: YjjG family noncanonical pyrimidine nucleotidase [Prevotella sp.]|nr:YjjG family noncanonical pyrimidine nucleotidase [Prevotella sp.]
MFTFVGKKQMKRYRDLFIDFDDTLYDTHGNAVLALRELYDELDLACHFPDADTFYDAYWRANIDLWRQYSKGEIERSYLIIERFRRPLSLGSGLNLTDEYCLKVSNRFLELCSSKPGLVEGARELTDYLLRQGYRLHMCSNGFHEVQYKKLRACGLDSAFTTVILSEDAGANKPSAKFFDYALRQAGANAESTLMIGDNYDTDIIGAQNAGLDTAFFNRFPEYPAPGPVTFYVTALCQLTEFL